MDAIKEGMLASAKAAEAAARIGERLFCQNTPNVMNFNSQICTTRVQSERLLALGLKKETADMAIEPDLESTYEAYYISVYPPSKRGIPAWSLHRLIEMMPRVIEFPLSGMPKNFYFEMRRGLVRYYNGYVCCVMEGGGYYEGIIDCIEWLIKEGYFNNEYLEEMSHD